MEILVINSWKPNQCETMDIRMNHEGRTVSEMSLTLDEAATLYRALRVKFGGVKAAKPQTLGEMEQENTKVFATAPILSQIGVFPNKKYRK